MHDYLIGYSTVKGYIEKGHSLSREVAIMIFDQFLNFPAENKLEIPTDFELILIEYLNERMDYSTAKSRLLEEAVKMLQNEKKIAWEVVRSRLGRNDLFEIIDEFKSQIDDKEYWQLIAYCYTSSDFCYKDYDTLKKYLNVDRDFQEFMMNEQERSFLESLPETFMAYRGCSIEEADSKKFRFSWTLDKKVANFFAFEHHRSSKLNCKVVEKEINKEDVLAYFNDRDEQEILLILI